METDTANALPVKSSSPLSNYLHITDVNLSSPYITWTDTDEKGCLPPDFQYFWIFVFGLNLSDYQTHVYMRQGSPSKYKMQFFLNDDLLREKKLTHPILPGPV